MIQRPDLFNVYRNSLVAYEAIWPADNQFCELNHQISGAKDLMGGLSELAASLGFDYFSYTIGSTAAARPERARAAQIRSNYPCQWTSHYDLGNYTTLDPIVNYAKRARCRFFGG